MPRRMTIQLDLIRQFIRFFRSNKVGVIIDFGHIEIGVWAWNIPLRRSLFDWELEFWNSFLSLLHDCRSSNVDHDWVSWVGSGDGKFSTKAIVGKLNLNTQPSVDWKALVWRGVAPPKVEVFLWLVFQQRIPVRVELASRGLTAITDLSCPLCGLAPESVSYLLFSCKVAWLVWSKCAAYWGLSLAFPGEPVSFLLAWLGVSDFRAKDSLWYFIPFAVTWIIWLSRNDIIFGNSRLDDVHLFFLVRFRVASWFKSKLPNFECSANFLISDLSLVDNLHMCKLKPPKTISWEPPPLGFLKLNVDGAMVSDGSKGGIGGIFHNSKGVRLASFSIPIGPGPAILAELEAISHGLECFYSLFGPDSGRLIVECDSSLAIDWIHNPTLCPSAFSSLVRKCKNCIESNFVVLRHISRVANLEADCLAKEGIG
ncbi:hypothetical protein GQ457_06G028210 [Hibiscus cannabinus]